MTVEQSLFFSYKKSVKTNIHLVYLILLLIVAGAAYGDDSTSQEQSNSTNNSYIDSRSYRCTAQDGSYSFYVRSSEPCPHDTDSRTPMVVVQAQPSEAYLAAQARIDKSDREAREFKQYSGETEADYKARMEASQNPLWRQDQEWRAREAANKAIVEQSKINHNVAQQSANTDSHVKVWVFFFAVLAVLAILIWWLRRIWTPATPVRTNRRTVSQQRPSVRPKATREPAPFREMSPPEPVQAEIPSPVHKFAAHEQVAAYLHAFETDAGMPPMAYRAEIKALNLDYSPESLERLDQFLVELRHRIQPSYADIVESLQLQQLVIFLGMYVGTTIARVTQQSIKWYRYEDAKAHLCDPEYPETLETLKSCMLGNGYHHLPIGLICTILYETDSTESCMERLNFYRLHADPLIPIPRSSLHNVVNAQNDKEQAWFNALSVAGISAATAMYKIDGDSSLLPTLTVIDHEDNKKILDVIMMDKSSDTAVEEMKRNPRDLPFKVLAYDSYANLPTGRMDAITIHTQCYGEFAATWIIVIPYRHASHPEGYAFYPPLIVSSSVGAEHNPMIMHAFYSGVAGMKLPDDPWNHYLQESDL
jgi:hypothetical protein